MGMTFVVLPPPPLPSLPPERVSVTEVVESLEKPPGDIILL
jgi:hypothetical protein